jgi:hypothetical protein
MEYTQEDVTRSINAAYDSVNLINELKAKETLTELEVDTLDRNERHIRLMLEKEWFVEGLTLEQKTELQAI